jgi:hypothetical protein
MDNGCILERTTCEKTMYFFSLSKGFESIEHAKNLGEFACLCHVSGEPTSSRRWDVYLLLFVYYCYYSLQQAAP